MNNKMSPKFKEVISIRGNAFRAMAIRILYPEKYH